MCGATRDCVSHSAWFPHGSWRSGRPARVWGWRGAGCLPASVCRHTPIPVSPLCGREALGGSVFCHPLPLSHRRAHCPFTRPAPTCAAEASPTAVAPTCRWGCSEEPGVERGLLQCPPNASRWRHSSTFPGRPGQRQPRREAESPTRLTFALSQRPGLTFQAGQLVREGRQRHKGNNQPLTGEKLRLPPRPAHCGWSMDVRSAL